MSVSADARIQGAILDLDEFLDTAGELTPDERRTIVDQALTLIDDADVHLPLKRSMHAEDPVQSLTLLRLQVGQLGERQFHDAMIAIFKGLRDLHTNYVLPAPYNRHIAFLPFMMKEYYDADGSRHYVVARMLLGMRHPTFRTGVEVTHWSGVPIDQAVSLNADREAGSNEAARHVRGLDAMTVRPMAMSLPPDTEWVEVGYRSDGAEREIRLPWRVFRPEPTGGPTGTDTGDASDPAVGLDLTMELTNQARKALFVDGAAKRSAMEADQRSEGTAAPSRTKSFLARNSLVPTLFVSGQLTPRAVR